MSGRRRVALASHRGPRILVVRRRYLGDTVLTEPLLRNLRAHWPEAWITVVLDTPWVDVLRACAEVDEIVEIPVGPLGPWAHVSRWARALRSVARRRYDLAFDLARNERALALLLASRSPRVATVEIEGTDRRRWLRWPYTDVVTVTRAQADGMHTVELQRRLLEAVDVPTPHHVPSLPVGREARAAAAAVLRLAGVTRRPGRPLLMVHPGSGSQTRRWPPAEFARAADHAVRTAGAQVVVLSGPAEPELGRAVTEAMTMPATLLADFPSVPTLFGLLAEADLLLCNDSGPMHMAAAVGTPVCALFGSQSVIRWAPLGSAGHVTFQATLPCGERCVSPGTCDPADPTKSFCVRRVGVEEVARALEERLRRAGPSGGVAAEGSGLSG